MAHALCVCGKCRVCKQREKRRRQGGTRSAAWAALRDAEIRMSGPQLRLNCQMIEEYAGYFAENAIGDLSVLARVARFGV